MSELEKAIENDDGEDPIVITIAIPASSWTCQRCHGRRLIRTSMELEKGWRCSGSYWRSIAYWDGIWYGSFRSHESGVLAIFKQWCRARTTHWFNQDDVCAINQLPTCIQEASGKQQFRKWAAAANAVNTCGEDPTPPH